MNLDVQNMTVFANTMAREGDRHFLTLNVSMSRNQIERALYTLLGQLTDEQAHNFLRSEFPDLFTNEESNA